MFQLPEYELDRAAAVLNVDPSDVRVRRAASGQIMVWSPIATAIGFGITPAAAVDSLDADVRREKRDAAYIGRAPKHCNEYELGCLDANASTCSCDCVPCHEAEFGPIAVKS